MLSEKIEKSLTEQIRIEAESSQIYLAMASWAETQGFQGVSSFMYAHSDEERMHMLKLVKYVNERGGHAMVTDLKAPKTTFGTMKEMFEELYAHELFVSNSINELVHVTFEEKDLAHKQSGYVSESVTTPAEKEILKDAQVQELKGILNLAQIVVSSLELDEVCLGSDARFEGLVSPDLSIRNG